MNYVLLAAPAILIIIALLVFGFVMARLYRKTKADEALVRTGLGGAKVILGGGGIIIPGLHEVMSISLKTMSIPIDGDEGLITQDSRRVDVSALFSIRVQGDADSIKKAATSLGSGAGDVDQIRMLLAGKVHDVMRSIAADLSLMDLHRERGEFQRKVHESLNKELAPNGLVLETVSITKLDETPQNRLDPNNSFDIAGMRNRSSINAEHRREQVKIEEEERLHIATTRQNARIQLLEVEREEEAASQKQKIEVAELAAESARKSTAIAEQTLEHEERARQNRELAIRNNEIENAKKIKQAEIDSRQEIELAEQIKATELAIRSEEMNKAEAQAAQAQALRIEAEEGIDTARKVAIAERDKRIAVIEAERQAEQKATSLSVQSRVEREAAADQAKAVIMRAEADAQATKIEADAIKEKGLAEAAAIEARVRAENGVTAEVMAHKERLATIEALPGIISAMVAPVSHIKDFRVNQVTGLGGVMSGSVGGAGGTVGKDGVVGEMMEGIRQNAVMMPLLQRLGKEIGMNFEGDLSTLIAPEAVVEIAPVVESADNGAAAKSDVPAPAMVEAVDDALATPQNMQLKTRRSGK